MPCDLVLEGSLNSMQIWEGRSQICVVINFDAPPEEGNLQMWEYVVTDEYIGRAGYVLYRSLELWYTRFTVYICSG